MTVFAVVNQVGDELGPKGHPGRHWPGRQRRKAWANRRHGRRAVWAGPSSGKDTPDQFPMPTALYTDFSNRCTTLSLRVRLQAERTTFPEVVGKIIFREGQLLRPRRRACPSRRNADDLHPLLGSSCPHLTKPDSLPGSCGKTRFREWRSTGL